MGRRAFLGAAGGVLAGGVLAGGALGGGGATPPEVGAGAMGSTVPFYGLHQAGVTTPPQRQGFFAAFDVTAERRSDLMSLLRRWTAAAAELCRAPGADGPPAESLPVGDAGEARGLGAARLTVTFGFGPSLFGVGAPDRFGLRSRWPMALVQVPALPGDRIDGRTSGGDLTVHACADDPMVAFHAVHRLAEVAGAAAALRWAQACFNEAAVTRGTPRNLTGFKDGTLNPTTDAELEEFVWVGPGQGPAWMHGGTYVVVRRIRILLAPWHALTTGAQERVIGRRKVSGAPLSGVREGDPLDLAATDAAGRPVIPRDAHVRVASPHDNWGQMILRRSYSYNNGVAAAAAGSGTAAAGDLDAGLLFVAYQQSPRLGALPILARLARHDALRRFTVHTASAVAAVPPAAPGPGHWVGEQLFG